MKIDLIYELDENAKNGLAFAPQYIPHHLSFIAAREIERLRAALEKYRGQVNQNGNHSAADDLDV